MEWELYPRYAEQPTVFVEAKTHAEAEAVAAALAKRGSVSLGYLPGGHLTPVRAEQR